MSKQRPKFFCIIITAYNCESYVEKNLTSVLEQKYDNYKVVYIDDASTDRTVQIAIETIARYKVDVKLKSNSCRLLRGENVFRAVSEDCPPDSITVLVDGDDWLAHDGVLDTLNNIYQTKNIWMTVGGLEYFPPVPTPPNLYYPDDWISRNDYRITRWTAPHLVSFFTWLFYSVKKQDLLMRGEFIKYAEDFAMIIPMLEMTNGRFYSCANDKAMYVYNRLNPLGTVKNNRFEQVEAEIYVRSLKKYSPLLQ